MTDEQPQAPRRRKPKPPPAEPEEPRRQRVVVERNELGRPTRWAEVDPEAAQDWDERLWHHEAVGYR
jgi:hypothetical protein